MSCQIFRWNMARQVPFAIDRTCSWLLSESHAPLWMLFTCFKDMRLDSCMSDSLSFVNKSNLCLILFSSSSKISDNHSGPHWGWKNHHAGIHICTICDGESCVVMDQSHTLKHTLTKNIYTNANIYKESISSFSLYYRHTSFSFLLKAYIHRYSAYTPASSHCGC